MFCPKCGTTLPDGSQFCPACGAQLGAQAPQQAAPQQAPAGTNAAGAFRMPNAVSFTGLFFALLCFIFGFLPMIHVKGYGGWGLFEGNPFDLNVLAGFAKIFMIIQIILFVIYLISQFVDFNKLLNLPFNVTEKAPIIYFCCYAAALLFSFIGGLVGGYGMHYAPAVCWYFAVVFCICGFIVILKPDLVKNVFANLVKKPQQ